MSWSAQVIIEKHLTLSEIFGLIDIAQVHPDAHVYAETMRAFETAKKVAKTLVYDGIVCKSPAEDQPIGIRLHIYMGGYANPNNRVPQFPNLCRDYVTVTLSQLTEPYSSNAS